MINMMMVMKTSDDDDNDNVDDAGDNGLSVDAIVTAVVDDDCEEYEHHLYDGIDISDACHKKKKKIEYNDCRDFIDSGDCDRVSYCSCFCCLC